MQIIQTQLGNNIHPLGLRTSLSNTHGVLFRKYSNFPPSRSNFISIIQTKAPLATSSKFLLSREHEPSIKPLIGWDSWDNQDINSEFPFIEFDPFDSIDSPENNNFNNTEVVKSSIPEILPTVINKNTSNDISPKLNIQSKTKSKKINKSQQQPKTKSRTKKSVKSSATKNILQASNQSNINHLNLIVSDEPLSADVNSELPTLQQDIALANTAIYHDSVSSITPGITAYTNVEKESTLFRHVPNEELQVIPDLPSSLPSREPFVLQSISPLQENTKLDNHTSELVDNSPREFTLPPNFEETFTPSSNLNSNEQKVITQASKTVDISDIPISQTPLQPNIETSQVDNKSTTSLTNLIQTKEVSPTLNSPLQEQELRDTNNNYEPITAIEPDLISESTTSNFDTANFADNSLKNAPLSSALTSPSVENTVGADSCASLRPVANPESSSAKNTISLKQEIDSSITSESLASAPVQLTPTSSNIEGTPNGLKKSDNNEQLITSESQVAVAVNVSDVPANVTSLQRDNNLDNTISDSTKSEPILAPPEIVEAPKVSNISPEIVETPKFNATLSEIVEAPKVSNISPEIVEAPKVSNISPKIVETPKFNAISPEIIEAPKVSNISPEIVETPKVSNISPEIIEAPKVSNISPEIIEAPKFNATLSEIVETPKVSNISREIVEAPKVSNISPEIIEAPKFNATLPEIIETPKFNATLSEIVEAPKVSNVSPEIIETPKFNTTSSEIVETAKVSNISPEIVETAKVSNVSPEIVEAPKVSNISPEIVEAAKVSNISPEIVETAKVSNISPEIVETAKVSNISPEIVETAKVSSISPEIVETAKVSNLSSNVAETSSIFRKIVENEEIAESELSFGVTNSEISTFIDTSDNRDIPEKPTSPQNQVSTPPEVEQNTTIKNLVAPKGYATAGQVTDSHIKNDQQIEASDTVPAMLTPGEFVINTRDAQKNLPLLQHINTGGTPQDIILPSLQIPNPKEPEQKTSPETSTKVDSFTDTSLQLKSLENQSSQKSNSLIPSSLESNVGKQKLSILNSSQISSVENKTIDVGETSPQYSSPPLIFRKVNSTNTPSKTSETPSQWSSVEELLNGNDDKFTSLFKDGESNKPNSELSRVSTSSESSPIFAKHLPAPRGFADGGEVTAPDVSGNTESVTETVENNSSTDEENGKEDTGELEALAREIYSRLRQRLEIERERQGGYSGRFSW